MPSLNRSGVRSVSSLAWLMSFPFISATTKRARSRAEMFSPLFGYTIGGLFQFCTFNSPAMGFPWASNSNGV